MRDVRDDVREIKRRLTAVELGLAGVRRDITALAEGRARVDRVGERLDRIERRLDPAPAG